MFSWFICSQHSSWSHTDYLENSIFRKANICELKVQLTMKGELYFHVALDLLEFVITLLCFHSEPFLPFRKMLPSSLELVESKPTFTLCSFLQL